MYTIVYTGPLSGRQYDYPMSYNTAEKAEYACRRLIADGFASAARVIPPNDE